MIRRVKKYIEDNHLLTDSAKVIVGVSGGADSVALLDMLCRLGYRCVVCHCNFRLRGNESVRDELFVQTMASVYALPYYKTDFDTEEFAGCNKISVEMAARELRYDWFETMRVQLKADAVAVAHHRDDSVETVLLNLARGTGIRGLTGIRPKNGKVIRPLLCLTRNDILTYVDERELTFMTDSTNKDVIYIRNFIRREIIPLFEQINPEFRESVLRTIDYLSGTESFYRQMIEQYKQKVIQQHENQVRISIAGISASASPITLLFEILSLYGFNSSDVSDVYESLNGISGKEFFSKSHRLVKDREYLILTENQTSTENDLSFPVPENTTELENPIALRFSVIEKNEAFVLLKSKTIACFDADMIKFPLMLRHWKSGDCFVPFGMTGKKKLSDYFSDRKFSLIDKENIWLLCSGNNIIWIVGERIDNRFRINDQTKRILVVEVKN
ncbi:MAG: tRNA lysidine(34) synthetase TilS [Candidatus Azobacteroides sp.]|nr:tRNA lysidine(34) synthetase TilS [Candidatus Azobacteroides sp.]